MNNRSQTCHSVFRLFLFLALFLFAAQSGFAQDEPVAIETEAAALTEPAAEPAPDRFVDQLNAFLGDKLGGVNSFLDSTLFYKIGGVPIVVAILFFGAVFFTVRFAFINFRAFKHAIDVVRGRYDDEKDQGEISHFRALTSALSATVGLGNIAGVAVAIGTGGPGAAFWMTVAGLLGMSSKFVECTLGQIYRKVNPDGTISGGGMYYFEKGFAEINPVLAPVGKFFAIIFAIIILGAAVGGGNMFQANQSFEVIKSVANVDESHAYLFGIVMAILVGFVIIGGIKRIGYATSRLVPLMAAIYILASLYIILVNFTKVPEALLTIVREAFNPTAVTGGIIGVMVIGIQRASFSSEAGIGSAAIAHSAAKTDEPVREGVVALLEPFIDTVIICNMTALVIVLSGVYTDPEVARKGVAMTKLAYEQSLSWFPWVLMACVILFAYSTMISWCYYGERGWIYLLDHFGEGVGIRTLIVFRLAFVCFVYIGTVLGLGAVIDFADYLLLSLAFPNIIGCIILSNIVGRHLTDYWERYRKGEMKPDR